MPRNKDNRYIDTMENPNAVYGKGNIDLMKRPVIKNPDGSFSTLKSMSFRDPDTGKETLIPMIRYDGYEMDENESIAWYKKTGQYLGRFDTAEEATTYAKELSSKQAELYKAYDSETY